MSLLKGNTDLPDPNRNLLPPEEDAVLDKLARKVVDRGFGMPAILFLESVKPLNYIGSQVLVFFEPMVQTIFSFKDYDTFRSALEKRDSIEIMVLKIEKYDALALSRERRIKKYMKEQKKTWKWHQRWLGLFRPRVRIPEEILNPPEKKAEPPTGAPSN